MTRPNREWFSDTCIRITRIDRAGGPRKTHAVRTSWQVSTLHFRCELSTKREALEHAAMIEALILLSGKEA